MLHTPQGLPNRLPCLTSSPPGHVTPIIVPLHRKAKGAISEAHWIYETDCDHKFTSPTSQYSPPAKSTGCHL